MQRFDKLRRSQVVFNSGPGAIVDLRDFSAITAGLSEWSDLSRLQEITFPNRRGFRRLVRPPTVYKDPRTNRELTPNGKMPTYRFPSWVQCSNPACNNFGPFTKISTAKSDNKCSCGHKFVPARIIKICPDGHMDDFPWDEYFHEGETCEFQHPKFKLVAAAEQRGTLNDLVLTCRCNRPPKGLGDIYNFDAGRKCWGRRPWLNQDEPGCARRAEVVLRGASNVYFPKIMSELMLPKPDTKLDAFYAKHMASNKGAYLSMAEALRGPVLDSWLDGLKSQVDALGMSRAEVASGIAALFEGKGGKGGLLKEEEIRAEEFKILINPSIVTPNVVPSIFSAKKISADVELKNRGLETLVSVSRLQEIRVLQGFNRVFPEGTKDRMNNDKGRLVDLAGPDGSYLAIEVNGEGLFLSFDNAKLIKWAGKQNVKDRAKVLGERFPPGAGIRPIPFEVDARAVFLHSFSHALIKQMALYGGYSSVAIREKLYLGPNQNGLLLYTGESDSEGTMGGITNLGDKDKFSEIFLEAIEDSRWCSSDPICSDATGQESDIENLAACHSCLFLSETSCEFSNKFLDRALVVSDYGIGFFDD